MKLPVLAKLMLAERFLPRLFDQLATAAATSPQGVCADLAALEAAAEREDETRRATKGKTASPRKDTPKLEVVKSVESVLLAEWISSKSVEAWAKVKRALGDVDLRPYLFVTKDRKDYFGAASVLGHLVHVVDRLLGGKMFVQGIEVDLKRLAPPEAAQVFEAVRGRIIGGDVFDVEPPGIAGLVALVKAQPPLQANLLDFLEGLPTDNLGPWAVKGWEGVIRDPDALARLDRLILAWASSGKSIMLKTTAATVAKFGRGLR